MISLNRSTDEKHDTVWVAWEREDARCRQLYLGKDVNGAIDAAMAAGLPLLEAVKMARTAIDRDRPIDDIKT